jgi:hypothetical protein
MVLYVIIKQHICLLIQHAIKELPPRAFTQWSPSPATQRLLALARDWFGLFPFRSPLLRESRLLSLLMKVKVQEPRTTPLPRKARGFCLAGTADSEFENGLRARMPPVPLISIFTPPHFFLARSTAATTPRFPELGNRS